MEPRISIVTLGVEDLERSFRFYHHGLGFPTTRRPEDGIVFFQMRGTCLALYPRDELAADVSPRLSPQRATFSGITLAHNTRTKEGVDEILELAERSGGRIEKRPQIASWGGYSGYFSDPDGYLWEIAWSASWRFHGDGSLVIE
jgi:catechol 2,3-dioxygenase-like lactoylglutathione lyase family enzyme